jgi:hypothetical protein
MLCTQDPKRRKLLCILLVDQAERVGRRAGVSHIVHQWSSVIGKKINVCGTVYLDFSAVN